MIRKAVSEDSQRIAEIHVFSYRTAFRGILRDKYLFLNLKVENEGIKYKSAIENNKIELYVYEEDEIVKGFITIGKCRDEDKKDSFELWGIYVEPLMMNIGIGTKLLEYCEKIAVEQKYNENMLWVFEENKIARRFYEKHGYFLDGKEDVMPNSPIKIVRYIKYLK